MMGFEMFDCETKYANCELVEYNVQNEQYQKILVRKTYRNRSYQNLLTFRFDDNKPTKHTEDFSHLSRRYQRLKVYE